MKKQIRPAPHGQAIAELPLVLFVFLVLVLFPIIDLCCITFRSTFMDGAARNAAHKAAKAHTFAFDGPDGLSASSIAKNEVRDVIRQFTGIRVEQVTPRIVRTSTTNAADVQRFEAPVPITSDSEQYVYQIEVEIKGEVDPLIPFNCALPAVPGLSSPMPFTATAREVFENTFWLTK